MDEPRHRPPSLEVLEHRLHQMEQEQLARRLSALEPLVRRMESNLEGLTCRVEKGMGELKAEVISQKALQRGVGLAVVGIVSFVQFMPYLGKLL